MRKQGMRAQSILEYVIVLTAIVTIIILAAGQWIKPAVSKVMNDTGAAISNASDKLANISP